MKKILLILALTILSCSTDGSIYIEPEPKETFTKEITYCIQDNLVSIDDKWTQSVFLETYEPANDILSAFLRDGKLELESVHYEIASVNLPVVFHTTKIEGNKGTVTIPDLQLYLYDTDQIHIVIEFFKPL